MLAERLQHIQPSATLALAAEASSMRALGHDIISLALGEPDGNPPQWVLDAVQQALDKGGACHKYTPVEGMLSLRQAIADDVKRSYNLDYNPKKEIIVGVGAKQVIYHALMATLNPGDEVIVPAPYWVSYPDMVQLAGGRAVHIPANLQPDVLEAAITPRTRWLILNSPSNPTGAMLDKNTLEGILPVLAKHPHVCILCDDIYQDLIYDGKSFESLAVLAPAEWKDRFLIVNGVSKSFAMTGWRVGYGCGPCELIQAMILIQSQSSSNTATIAQMAAEAAIKGSRDFLNDWRVQYQRRRDLCRKVLDRLGMDCPGGEGAFYLFASCHKWLGKRTPQGDVLQTDVDVARYLLHQHHLVLVPGVSFGAPGFLRLSYATSSDILTKGLGRLEKAYDACQ